MPAAFPSLGPEYDRFLYAIVCNERNGMELTMASAIARSGADPWQEAALIAKMPKDVALRVLARFIPEPPDRSADPVDVQLTIDRLFALLPTRRNVAAPLADGGMRFNLIIVFIIVALCVGFALSSLVAPKSGGDAEPSGGAAPQQTSSEGLR